MYADSSIRSPQAPERKSSAEKDGIRKDSEDTELKYHRSRLSTHTQKSGMLLEKAIKLFGVFLFGFVFCFGFFLRKGVGRRKKKERKGEKKKRKRCLYDWGVPNQGRSLPLISVFLSWFIKDLA